MPVAIICAAVPQLRKPQFGASRQLLFSAMTFCPEKRRKNGSASTPGTENGAVERDGPRPRMRTVFGTVGEPIDEGSCAGRRQRHDRRFYHRWQLGTN